MHEKVEIIFEIICKVSIAGHIRLSCRRTPKRMEPSFQMGLV